MFCVEQTDSAISEIVQQLNIKADIAVSLEYNPGNGLSVRKSGSNAIITYGRRVELFRALGLLAQHSNDAEYFVKQNACFRMNGVMLDCSRNGVARVETVKKMIRYMALMGLDMLMLYTEDTYEVPEYPYFGYMRGRYTIDEIQEMDSYASSYGIEMIPCIQTLAHLAATLRWEVFDPIKDNDDILLCGDERTYEFIEAMIRSCRNSYRTNRIHIGFDEAFMLGLGRYRMKNGIRNRDEIFCEHLSKVNEICQKYDFRPMIWSDMFYRIAFNGNYSPDQEIAQSVIDMVPPDVDLVYWDYYRHEKEAFCQAFDSHLQFNNPILFAGGSWRWTGYVPHTEKSLESSAAALAACAEKGIQEVFCTAWGDGGNETPIFVILPTLQLYAEYGYQADTSVNALRERLFACTGESYDDMLLLDNPDKPDGKYRRIETNPSRYLLYMDVLGGVFERHTEPCYRDYYTQYARELAEAATRSRDNGYIYDLLSKLCDLLAVKSCVGVEAQKAYLGSDMKSLRNIADVRLPEIAEKLEQFRLAVQKRWEIEYKYSGFDVLDHRLGGVAQRIKTAICRIHRFLDGDLDSLEELEGKRLPFNSLSDEELEKERVMCWGITKHHFSPNVM